MFNISPEWFIKNYIRYNGDLYKFYHGCHKNYSLTTLVGMYNKINKVCKGLPPLVFKNTTQETMPEESKLTIQQLLEGNKPKENWIENFSNHRQQMEKLRNRKFGGKAKK